MDSHVDDGFRTSSLCAFIGSLPEITELPAAINLTGLTESALDGRVRSAVLPPAMLLGGRKFWLKPELLALIDYGPPLLWADCRDERPGQRLVQARLTLLRELVSDARMHASKFDQEIFLLKGEEAACGSVKLEVACRKDGEPLVWWALNYTYGTVRRNRSARIFGLSRTFSRGTAIYRRMDIIAFNLMAQIARTEALARKSPLSH